MRTFICSVVFLDIAGFSKRTVDEQIVLKERLNSLISEAIADFPESEHIILDSGDGAAIGFAGDPEHALFFAMGLRDAIVHEGSGMMVRIGINLGPVKLVKDINGHPNLIGDGINVAQRIMSFAEPGQVTVSRSFHEVTSCLSRDIARLYQYIGLRTDKNIRRYQVYTIGSPNAGSHSAYPISQGNGESELQNGAVAGQGEDSEYASLLTGDSGKKGFAFLPVFGNSRMVLSGLVLVAVIAVISFSLSQRLGIAVDAEQKSTANDSVRAFDQRTSAGSGTGKADQVRDATAYLHFRVSPRGVIYIDGKRRGIAPPLRELQVKTGEHTIMVVNKRFKPYKTSVNLGPRDRILIRHEFHGKGSVTAHSSARNKTNKSKKRTEGKIHPAAFTATFSR